jgi:hypothetical protein
MISAGVVDQGFKVVLVLPAQVSPRQQYCPRKSIRRRILYFDLLLSEKCGIIMLLIIADAARFFLDQRISLVPSPEHAGI